jgi:glucokinase
VLQEGGFMSALRDKGRFSEWTGSLSVKVALNSDAPLLGAAYQAASLIA